MEDLVKVKVKDHLYGEIEIYDDKSNEKIANSLDNTKLFECVEDRQGGDFCVGLKMTEKEWFEKMLFWTESDENYGLRLTLTEGVLRGKQFTIIGLVDDCWEITIEEVK